MALGISDFYRPKWCCYRSGDECKFISATNLFADTVITVVHFLVDRLMNAEKGYMYMSISRTLKSPN